MNEIEDIIKDYKATKKQYESKDFTDVDADNQAYYWMSECYKLINSIVKDLLEMQSNHEPVEVPEFIKNVMQQYNSLQEMLTEEYYSNDTSEIDQDAVFCWIDENFDLLCRAWLYGCTVAKEPLYFWRLNLQSTILYQFAIRRGSSYILKSGFPIAECAMSEKTAKEILRTDFDLFKPIEPKLNDGTIVDAVPVEEEAE